MLTLDYTQKDYAQMLAEVKAKITVAHPEWTDFLDSDIGFALIKAVVGVADVNNFYLDRQGAEVYLDTASERANVVSLAKSLGYSPKDLTPARVVCEVRLLVALSENVIIPAHSSFVIEGKEFITEEECVIPAGSLTSFVQCVQGGMYSVTSSASGEAFYKVTVPLDVTELEVYVNGVLWTPTSSFLVKPTNPNGYRVYEDRDRRVVMFGSALYTIPASQATIEILGIQTTGAAGNTRGGILPATIASPIYNSVGGNITNLLSATTTGAAVGGADAESVDSIRRVAPGVYSTQNRAVTAGDYEYRALAIPGVTEASAWGGELINRYGEVYVCISTNQSEGDLGSLVELVTASIEPIKTLGMQLRVIGAENLFVDLNVVGTVKRQANEFGLQSVILARIQEYFNSLSIGSSFEFSDLMAYVQQVTQLENFMLTHRVRATGVINFGEFTANRTRNANYAAATIRDANGTLVWSAAAPGAVYTTPGLKIVVGGLAAGAVSGAATITFDSNNVNVLAQPYHKVKMGTVSIALSKE